MLRYLLVVLSIISGADASDWPRFRGTDGNAASPAANVPTDWSATRNMAWSTQLPGHGASSPIVMGDRIYLTAFSGYGLDADDPGDRDDLMLHVLCFDLQSGDLQWDSRVPPSDDEQKATRRVADHGFATGTPVCDELSVYAYFGVSGLVAFDHEGNQLWRSKTGSKTAGFGSAASPILYRNLVIMNASIESGTVFAFDRKTGREVWKIEGVERSWTTPIVGQSSDGRDELILSYKEHLRGVDPSSGNELWNCVGIQDYVVPCVVINEGVAYVLGGRKNQSMAVKLGGTGDVTESHRLWETNIGANVTSPVYHDGMLYWASDRGIANCMNARTGESVYRERMDTKARVYASAVLAGKHLFLTTRDNGIFAVETGPEFKVASHNTIEGDTSMFNATPCIAGDQLLIRTNNKLYCIGTRAAE